MFSDEQDRLFEHLAKSAAQAGLSIFVVGGTIRDLFLGNDPSDRDIDFLVAGNALDFADRYLSDLGGILKRFDDFYTAKIISPNGYQQINEIDLASSRTEFYRVPGALPNVSLGPIEQDLARRDFTINAMAVPLDKLRNWGCSHFGDRDALAQITLDYFSGLADLGARRIRVIHNNSFLDDPTRIFRGVRYAVRIAGHFDSNSEELVIEAIKQGAIATLSKNRVINEIKKMAAEKNLAKMISELDRLGVMKQLSLYPESDLNKVLNNLESLETKFSNLAPKIRFQVLVRVFFSLMLARFPEQEVRHRYSEYNFGTKEINKLVMETTMSTTEIAQASIKLNRISDAGLVFQSILLFPSQQANLRGELQKRGLITDGV